MSIVSVEQTITDLDAAFNRGDLEAVLDCYEDGAVLMVEPGRSIAGKDNLRGFYELTLGSGSSSRQDRMQVILQGDIALYLSRWTLTVAAAGAEIREHALVATSVLRRGADGRWRLAIDNSYGPLVLDQVQEPARQNEFEAKRR
jgi:uncharacterized protein (TIGR02246 family)